MKNRLFLTQSVTFALDAARETLRRCSILLAAVNIDGPWLQVDIAFKEQEDEDVATRHMQITVTLCDEDRTTLDLLCSVEKVQRINRLPEWATCWMKLYVPFREDGDDVYFSNCREHLSADKKRVFVTEVICSRTEEDGVTGVTMYR